MASKHILILLAIALPVLISAKDFMVGDHTGWTINFDYQTWAEDKEFYVGDKLIFSYPVGSHNVFKVNGTGFQNCIKPALSEALISGNDTIVLATPGRKWYICGVGQHCASGGQKLFIVVNAVAMSPGASPSQSFGAPTQALPATGSANGVVLASFQSILAMALAIFFVTAV
ncbi:blue copper protein 1b-like [Apium graveolens]|uniref:blue copper protein 1b-like n=1 Tax=Apium graveolens TaxID=4045 RepID=UPI003D791AA1